VRNKDKEDGFFFLIYFYNLSSAYF
jgi:hypothetical protein